MATYPSKSCLYPNCSKSASKQLDFGFTVVELMVVISIISLLLSILMPTVTRVKSMAMRIKCTSNLRQVNLAVNMYLDTNDGTYPCAQDPLPEGYWLWMGRGWRNFLEPYLNTNIDANNPSVLVCPADFAAKEDYEATSYSYSMAFYHTPGQIDSMTGVADTYGGTSLPSVRQRCLDVAKPGSKIIIGEWLSNHEPVNGNDPGWWGWVGCRNYLFVDGHVRYLPAKDIRQANDGFPNPNLTVEGIKGIDWSP